MTVYISVTDTAKLVRAALKENFPGAKFSVRTSKYAGGASLDVQWTAGPAARKVDEVVSVFVGTAPDRSGDFYDPVFHEKDGQRIHYGADHIRTSRTIAPATAAKIRAEVLEAMGKTEATVTNWDSYEVPPIVLQRAKPFGYAQGTIGDFVRAIANREDDKAN